MMNRQERFAEMSDVCANVCAKNANICALWYVLPRAGQIQFVYWEWQLVAWYPCKQVMELWTRFISLKKSRCLTIRLLQTEEGTAFSKLALRL